MVKPVKQKLPRGSHAAAFAPSDEITDPRFTNIQTDPKFRLPSKRNTHVRIDKRFAHMLSEERFSSQAKVDRYGRKLPKDVGKELGRFYEVEEDDGDQLQQKDAKAVEAESDEGTQNELERLNVESYDPARDGGFSDSSSSEESSEEEEIQTVAEELEYPQQQGDDIPAGEVTSRLGVVNLDWDNIRAVDLMAVFSSFLPSNGTLEKVAIYPSEFGKERMDKEEMEGPPKELFHTLKKQDPADGRQSERQTPRRQPEEASSDIEDGTDAEEEIRKSLQQADEGAEFDQSHLRRYQLERLRYFYAVLICSSPEVAQELYNHVDGTEYLTTANFFDLRFIPDEMDFSDDKPRDECERIPGSYKPNDFVTDALQHSKVKLTWDADDAVRKEVQRKAFRGSRAEIEANDLEAYLGSDSSDDEQAPAPIVVDSTGNANISVSEDPELALVASKKDAERQRIRSSLGLGQEAVARTSKNHAKAPVGDLQITFTSGLSEPTGRAVFENEPQVEETTAERYARKEKERKARRKEKMRAAREGPVSHEAGSKKNTSPSEDHLGFDDPFFAAPEENTVTASAARKEAKRLKREERAAAEAVSSAERAELELLMVDESRNDGNVQHFDINAIAKAEKVLKKKKTKKISARVKEALEAKERDDFAMDVADPRFSAVFEKPEFALEPSHPRFMDTEGMKQLLEEGRKKRRVEDPEEEEELMNKRSRRAGPAENQENDLRRLVERVKAKTRSS